MNKFVIKKQLLTALGRCVFSTYSNKLQLQGILVLQSTKSGLRKCGGPNQESSLPALETDILVLYPHTLYSSTSTFYILVQILTQPKFVTEYKSLQALNFMSTFIQTKEPQVPKKAVKLWH
ncbi:Hypothetical_protein [Hexamita inflata]|uniref:Hypothetical_protein n=1 Tax=Hexamita inflata TaxID=28002 RepID=A0AA86QEC6_9EUKA|nr:Hypothetical protein HINF_LOCUS44795 [Hexamita inflata]